ncbi:hypothetical protein QR680_013766 [Steinernema hermaphroditum]|uniref:Uncharacterized protein n=1 Tax=Steinernema hermaphroditum TaxID=289476 RepID=A0AA39M2X1_9BILA|nr:hypothetical protein QR680_013766 [Steinernema hermaphroditum]
MLKAVLLAVVLVAFVEAWMEPEVCTSPPPPGEIPPLARLYYDQYCDSLKPGRGTPHLLNKGNFVPTEGERPPMKTALIALALLVAVEARSPIPRYREIGCVPEDLPCVLEQLKPSRGSFKYGHLDNDPTCPVWNQNCNDESRFNSVRAEPDVLIPNGDGSRAFKGAFCFRINGISVCI